VIKSEIILIYRHETFCGRGDVHTGLWWENSSPHTCFSGDKIRINFNGQAWGHFGLEERFIQDFGGEIPHPIPFIQVIRSGIILMDSHGAILL